jgi:hypothetical protein
MHKCQNKFTARAACRGHTRKKPQRTYCESRPSVLAFIFKGATIKLPSGNGPHSLLYCYIKTKHISQGTDNSIFLNLLKQQ